MNPADWLDYEIFGNPVLTWGFAAGLFAIIWLALLVLRRTLFRRLSKLEERKDDVVALDVAVAVVRATRGWFLFLIALFLGSRLLDMSDNVSVWSARATMIATLLQLGLWLSAGVVESIHAKRERDLEESPDGVAAMDILSFIARVTIWTFVLLAVLDNLGVNITTMIEDWA